LNLKFKLSGVHYEHKDKFAAALAEGAGAFTALQFTPAGSAIDAAFMVAFGLKAGFELGKFFYDAFQAKDEAGIKTAAESLKSAIEDGGPVMISGLAGGLKSATGLLTKLKGGKQAGQTAQALSQLKPQQVAQFEQAIALRNAGKGREAEAILNQLRTTLGKENFAEIEQHILARITQEVRRDFTIKEPKFDYFFGRVASNPKNQARSLQNLKDLKALGIDEKVNGRERLMEIFQSGLNSPTIKTKTNEYGTTVIKQVEVTGEEARGALEISYFYPKGDLSAAPEVTTIIPKIYKGD
jgi:hypothetical protein